MAQYKITQGDLSVATIQKVVNPDGDDDGWCVEADDGAKKYGCIIGLVSDADGLTAQTAYTVRVAGLRNPRHVIDYEDSSMPTAEKEAGYW